MLAKHLDARKGKDGRISVRTIALDGSQECSIQVSDKFKAEIACWSPNGVQIAVAAYQSAAFSGGTKLSRIFVVDSKGSHITEVALKNSSQIRISTIDWSALQLQSK